MNRPTILLSVLFLTFPTGAEASDWRTVDVPGQQQFKGHAWYRTWFQPHASFFSKHERNLFGESAVLNIRGLPGAHEVFVNGKKIGGGGAFPPEFQDGRDGNHRHKIPSGLLIKGQWNEVTIRVFDPTGQGGFQTEAPFVMNYFQECAFAGKWEFRVGDKPPPAGGPLKVKPASTGFNTWHESHRVLGEAEKLIHGPKLSPKASFAKMQAADDLTVELLLHEPLVAQPTHFSFDARGRLWIAQYRQYPYPAGLKMISRDRYYRSHYDRTPPAPPNHTRGRDVISIHEDTNGDGQYDKHKVFQDGLNMANAALRGRGGVWVMHTPYLLFYPDKNFDDVPDGPPVVHLQGFGLEDTHSVANGLTWGMDGWLYGAQGSTTTCHVTRPGVDEPDEPGLYYQGCMVWRYHPETRRFELFSEGGGNNFGLEVDSAGRIFTGHNGGQTRGWHYLQGGMHLMQGKSPNKYGPPRNPFAFGELPKMASEQNIARFTHFATVVESTALPAKYQGSLFSVEPLHNFVIASRRITAGSTFKTSDTAKVVTSADSGFRPVYIDNSPDGSIVVADFYEHYIAHGQHYQSQIDPTTGRIYRVRGKDERLETDFNLHDKTTAELIELLNHSNRWHRHTAVRLLGERKDADSAAPLRGLVTEGKQFEPRAALWALHQAFGIDQATALTALRHDDPVVRYWAVRLICDDVGFSLPHRGVGLVDRLGELDGGPSRLNAELLDAILKQAKREPIAEVRSQFAASARRLPTEQAMPLVATLLEHSDDVNDAYLPLMCWWVLEANLDRGRERVLALFEEESFRARPMVVRHILARTMRALALKGRRADLLDCAKLLSLASEPQQVEQLLAGFELAYAGRRIEALPEPLVRALVDSGRTSLALRLRLGDADAMAAAVALLKNPKTDMQERIGLARILGELQAAAAQQPLLDAAATGDTRLQRAALVALSKFDDPKIGPAVLERFPKYRPEVQPAFFDIMLSRPVWAQQLIEAITDGRIELAVIPEEVLQRLRHHPNNAIAQSSVKHFGPGRRLERADAQARIREIRSILDESTGNPYAGEAIYTKRCAACHKLFHKGGQVGPDLTPYQRGKLDTLLLSVVDPNAEIREGFETMSLVTRDGRVYTGFIVDQDTQVVVLRPTAGENIRVPRKKIEALEPTGRSLMPEGLLHGLSDEELRNLFAYLRISQPISN